MLLLRFNKYILGLAILATSSLALSNTEFTYNVIDGGIEVTGCVNQPCPTELNIPESIDGYIVTKVADWAFMGKGIQRATLPDSVNVIGEDAFRYNSLEIIDFPDNLESIGYRAFFQNQLAELTFPETLNSIGGEAFFFNDITSINFNEGLTILGSGAFSMNNLTSLDFPSTLQRIESNVFINNNLLDISFPENLAYIGDSAFNENNISSAHFRGDRPEIDGDIFSSNPLSFVTFCEDTAGWPGETIDGMYPELDSDCQEVQLENLTWDFDQNGSVKALSDGLLFLRHAFGIRGDSLTSNVISPDSLLSYEEVISNVEGAYQIADIDNNDAVDPLTDGLILLRYAFGLRGDSLISGVISPDANRTTASDIEAYIESHMP